MGQLPPFRPGIGQVWVTLVDDSDNSEVPKGMLFIDASDQEWADRLVGWLAEWDS